VNENQAFEMCRKLSKSEGLLLGISSGAAIFAATQVAARDKNQEKNIVVIAADTGQRYLSVKGLFD